MILCEQVHWNSSHEQSHKDHGMRPLLRVEQVQDGGEMDDRAMNERRWFHVHSVDTETGPGPLFHPLLSRYRSQSGHQYAVSELGDQRIV